MPSLFLVINNDKFFLSHRTAIALAAQSAGYDVTVVTHFTGRQEEISALGLKCINLPIDSTGMNPFHEFKSLLWLIRFYRKHKPDIIHHVGLKPILWGTIAAVFTGRKNVVNAISGLGILFSGGDSNGKSKVGKIVCAALKIFNKKSYKYIFQNEDDKSLFLSKKIISENQCVMIKGSGVDLEKFKYRSENEIDSSRIRIVFTGRMIEAKGVLVLVSAARKLKSKYYDKLSFIFCGGLDANPTALKENDINSFCDGEYIKWLGFQSDIYSVLRECHIMAFPSFYGEGLPKSVIDAEAVGLPVITTDSVGCRDTVRDGYNGFVIPPRNSDVLAEKIEWLAENPDKRREMGKNSRLFAEENFSIENVVQRHLEIYNSYLNTKNTGN